MLTCTLINEVMLLAMIFALQLTNGVAEASCFDDWRINVSCHRNNVGLNVVC